MIKVPDKRRLTDISAGLLRDEPAFRTSQDFGALVQQGPGRGPSILVGDHSIIEIHAGDMTSMLDYRMSLLAQPGDIVIVRHRSQAFEAYLGQYLGIRGSTFLEAVACDPSPVARQCRTAPQLRGVLQQRLADTRTLTLRSYLTTGHEWRLALSLGQSTGYPVHVYGPAPRIARRVNDKLWFWRLARRVLGVEGVPPSFHAYGPAAAAAQVVRIRASGHDAIIKVPSGAGGAGNLRLSTEVLDGLGLRQVRALIVGRLRAIGWTGKYPILVGIWECGVTHSPSAQVFVPLTKDGPPVVEGLFEQQIAGVQGEFVGAVPATLPPSIRRKMCREAMALASILQALGFFGWCSFDAILRDEGTLHWIECNGRWSGVSIPLAATRNLIGHTPGGIAIAQDHIERRALPFERLTDNLDDLLLGRERPREGLVLTSPQNTSASGLSFNAIAVADDQHVAEAILEKARDRLR